MRVLLDVKANPKTGKGFFIQRLAREFANQGVTVVSEGNHDIYLGVNSFKHKTKAPKVLRVNGVYQNKAVPYRKMNEQIAVQCRKADGIIYQSQWAKQMHHKFVGTYKVPTDVIFNGASIGGSVAAYCAVSVSFCAVSRWRPHKRLGDIQKAFELANIPDSCLWASDGEPNDVVQGRMAASTALIHICWQDACPNSVVEALALGTPVITNNVGGTRELIREGCGEVCEIDEPYDMRPVKLYKPPPVDHKVIAEAMWDSLKWPRVTNNAHVDIVNIAKQYKSFFEGVLNG